MFFPGGLDVQVPKQVTPMQALAPNPWLPDRQPQELALPIQRAPEAGKDDRLALKPGLTRGSCWGGFSALQGCFYSQVIGYSSENLTSHTQGAQRQAQGRVIQHQIVGFEQLFKKRNSKVLRVSPTDFASNTLVSKYCVHESSPRASSCTL